MENNLFAAQITRALNAQPIHAVYIKDDSVNGRHMRKSPNKFSVIMKDRRLLCTFRRKGWKRKAPPRIFVYVNKNKVKNKFRLEQFNPDVPLVEDAPLCVRCQRIVRKMEECDLSFDQAFVLMKNSIILDEWNQYSNVPVEWLTNMRLKNG